MKPIRYFSMFSGIGGFEYGMQQSNYTFENVGYSEIDHYARNIYEKHYPNHICFGDATKINTKDLPNFSLLIGGFPCQTFSLAGKRAGFNDTRGTMFFELARILKDKRPKYFLFENVKGLLSHEGGATFQTILEILNELRYNVQWQVYNSRDYNVPQNRERIFIKGYLGRGGIGKVLSIPRTSEETNVRLKKLNIEVDVKNNTMRLKTNTEKGYDEVTNGDGVRLAHPTSTKARGRTSKNSTGTLSCSNSCDWGTIDNLRIRRLTPVECERLQAFPDNYTKYGADGSLISDTQRYKCIGNAVTTTVITAIINEMFSDDNTSNT